MGSTFCGLVTLSVFINLSVWLYFNDLSLLLTSLGKLYPPNWQLAKLDKRVQNSRTTVNSQVTPVASTPSLYSQFPSQSQRESEPTQSSAWFSDETTSEQSSPSFSPQITNKFALVFLALVLNSSSHTWSAANSTNHTNKSVMSNARDT